MTLDKRHYWGARPGHRDELVFRERRTTGAPTLNERLYCLMDYFSPAAIVDLSGTVLERYAFSAFGKRRVLDASYNPRPSGSSFDWDFAFQGQFLDLETWNGAGEQTGLYDYGFRYYIPALGRWPNRDPIGEISGSHLYIFSDNNGVNAVDLVGLLTPYQQQGAAGASEAARLSRTDRRFRFGQREYCGLICCNANTHAIKHTSPHPGPIPRPNEARTCDSHIDYGLDGSQNNPVTCKNSFGDDWVEVGAFHSHPDPQSTGPSWQDLAVASNRNTPEFVGLVTGTVWEFIPTPMLGDGVAGTIQQIVPNAGPIGTTPSIPPQAGGVLPYSYAR